MAKKFIDKDTYAQKQKELEMLLKLTPKITLVPGFHNINMIPDDLNIHFIASELMENFEVFKDSDIRTVKLVNYGKPAVALSFFLKHKYFVDKKQPKDSIYRILKTYQKELEEKQKTLLLRMKNAYETLPMDKMKALADSYAEEMNGLTQELAHWSEQERLLDKMEWVVSNYEHNFEYYELGYKYWDSALLEYVIYNSHMIKNQTNRAGKVSQIRHNIIFVDKQAIGVHIPNQHKVVEKFLASFPQKFKSGTRTVYLKSKEEEISNNKVNLSTSTSIDLKSPDSENKRKSKKTEKSLLKSSQFSITAAELSKVDVQVVEESTLTPHYSEVDFEISLKKIASDLPNAVISQAFNMIEKQLLRTIMVKKNPKGYLLKIPNNSLIELDEFVYKLIKDIESIANLEGCNLAKVYAVALDDTGLIWT